MIAMVPRCTGVLLLAFCSAAWAQAASSPAPEKKPGTATQATNSAQKNSAPENAASPDKPGSNADSSTLPDDRAFSSSREAPLDLSPPKDDRKDHPNSTLPDDEDAEGDTGVQEFHSWNPMKALKDIEVGDYYFKRKNYRAALERYKEALTYKEGDAVATFRLAKCQERMGNREAALDGYAAYLKILPNGPFAQEAREAIEDLKAEKGRL